MVRDFSENVIRPQTDHMWETGEFPYDIVRQMGELGLFGIPFPEEYGGAGGDYLALAIGVEEIARVDGALAVTVEAHTSLAAASFYYFGTEQQKREWLIPLAEGKMLGAFGLTEPEAGSDAANTQTKAELINGEWVINGTKCFISSAGTDISGVVTITAVTGQTKEGAKEISNIYIPKGTPGYNIGPKYKKMGWHASDTRELSFDDCRVPESNIIGKRGEGFRQFMGMLDGGRIAIAALAVGTAQGAFEEALKYAKERVQFGKPICHFQAIQWKLADMATHIELARNLTYKAAAMRDAGVPHTKEAAMAKLFASEMCMQATTQAVQIFGGYGYMDEYPVSRYFRDAKILEIGEGTSEVQRMVIARELGLR
ncbi:MAG: acyl-CoA dehydrogenase [Candidatus Solincola sediminis]|uniref:Acyl-CoA dehydrogenase n=1 Tax=Candidatus Solincola sediminis TaxID=1797199 RepID=A0A1F2WKG4_9ACTN|nr:MAG: acyl-CoA dehydrogenase [Candidatus Solincola sediminis]OFW57360.1 MAG: acyl-CoA dehydrogenase [Candidatus Solincola sediminis]